MHILKTASLSLIAATIAAAPALAQEQGSASQHKKLLKEIRAIIREEVKNAIESERKNTNTRRDADTNFDVDVDGLKLRIADVKKRIAIARKGAEKAKAGKSILYKLDGDGNTKLSDEVRVRLKALQGKLEHIDIDLDMDDLNEKIVEHLHLDGKGKAHVIQLGKGKAQVLHFGEGKGKVHVVHGDGEAHVLQFGDVKGKVFIDCKSGNRSKGFFISHDDDDDEDNDQIVIGGADGKHYHVQKSKAGAKGGLVFEAKGSDGDARVWTWNGESIESKGDKSSKVRVKRLKRPGKKSNTFLFKSPKDGIKVFRGKTDIRHEVKVDGDVKAEFMFVRPDGKISKSSGMKSFSFGPNQRTFHVKVDKASKSKKTKGKKAKKKKGSKAKQNKASCCCCCKCNVAVKPSVVVTSPVKSNKLKTVKLSVVRTLLPQLRAQTSIKPIRIKAQQIHFETSKPKSVRIKAQQIQFKAPKTPGCCQQAAPKAPKSRIMD